MKTQINLAALALLSSITLRPLSLLGQGSLTPPGAPAPTMKSLDQIEARTPILSVPFTITNPGSYYLTTNVTTAVSNAIVIAANGVTLDLNGFTVSSSVANAANGGSAILLNSVSSDITIANGHIRGGVTNNGSGVYSGGGFGSGILYVLYTGNQPVNVQVSRVSVSGCLNYGIALNLGDSTVVENCTVRTVGRYGIAASNIRSCSAVDCGDFAIFGDQVSDCRGTGSGYDAVVATVAQNCYGYTSTGSGAGINATTALNCYGSSGNGEGVRAYTALNCYGSSSSSDGIDVTTAVNCYGSGSSYGIYTTTAQNCYGSSSSGTGLYAYRSAVGCHGESNSASGVGLYVQTGVTFASFGHNSTASGLGLQAYVATGCYGQNASGTSESINFPYNMP